MPCNNCGSDPTSCVLAGIIVGVILIILLSSCGFVKVPVPEKAEQLKSAERCGSGSSTQENLNIRPKGDPMKEFRGDDTPPVVMGDPFVLSMQTGSSGVSPY